MRLSVVTLCIAIAVAANAAGRHGTTIGAPIFAIAFGVVITNALRAHQIGSLRQQEQPCLKGGIILPASLDWGHPVDRSSRFLCWQSPLRSPRRVHLVG
jgi:hypothetical protein